jgi:hypothetical protein
LWYTGFTMNTYIYNPGRCPQFFGANVVIPPGLYTVVPKATADDLIASGMPVQCEGTPDFQPLWVENIPDKTPDQICG